MKDKEYLRLIEFANVGGGFIPANEAAQELLDNSHKGEIIQFREVTHRDIKFHRAYFALLNFVYDYLPFKFRKKVRRENFYIWLKHLKGSYQVLFEFKDGTKLVEYDSISFGMLSQKEFEEYVRMQLPYIYENVIGEFFEGQMYDSIIQTIEEEFQKFLAKL
jgi:hypothetical protein